MAPREARAPERAPETPPHPSSPSERGASAPPAWRPGVWTRLLLATVSGVMIFTSFPTYDVWPLAYVGLVPLLLAVEGRGGWSAFRLGALMGLVTNLGGFYWINGLLENFGHLSFWVAAPITALMCGYQGLLFGAWVGLVERARGRWRSLPLWAAAAPLLLALEFVVPFLFPWYLGNSQYLFYPAVQIADILGVLGVSLTVLLVNLAVYECVAWALARRAGAARTLAWRFVVVALGLVVASLVYGVVRMGQIDAAQAEARKLRIGMVEANIGVGEKEVSDRFEVNNLTHQALSQRAEAAGAELIVWPESSYQSYAIWGSTLETDDRLLLELDSLYTPELRDALLPALRALEVGFGAPLHHQPGAHAAFFYPGPGRQARGIAAAAMANGFEPGYSCDGAPGFMRCPFSAAPPDEATFFLPSYDALTPLSDTRACQSSRECAPDELCLTKLGQCARRGETSWSSLGIRRGFTTPILFGGLASRPKKPGVDLDYRGFLRAGRDVRDLYNVAFLLDGEGRVLDHYKKVFLLMFGEAIPLGESFPWLYEMIPEAGSFSPGVDPAVFELDGVRLGVLICYEDILPRFTRRLAEMRPQMIINVTNDAWFGKTSEPYLHLALATLRAVETRTWLVRSTNTGVSAFVDANGRIRQETSLDGAEILVDDVAIMSGEPTLYTRIGDLLGWLALLASAGVLIQAELVRRRAAGV